jgi:hypothetical protein
MDPRTVYDGTRGGCAVNDSTRDMTAAQNETLTSIRDGVTFGCYKNMGFTDECAFVHATTDLVGGIGELNCTETCTEELQAGAAPNLLDTCELNGCLTCEKEGKDSIGYIKWPGRDLKNSGLVMYNQFYHVKYECSYYMEENKIIKQNPYAKGNDAPADPPSKKDYGGPGIERFDPSVSIQLNQDSCLYNLAFSFKHDPTLPHAGGWDESLPNGVDRDTFEEHCSRDDLKIAEDGLPYRDRRKFTYNFEDDVKEITGIFDHMNIDFNPCGHHDEIFFGRPHYDMHMYTVPEYWRDIMQCDVTSCDYQDCKYDRSNQETEVGKAFFDLDVCREPFPNYILDNIPPDAAPPIKPGSFNKNMPFGFLHLPHTGNPRSGVHSINALTALQWNDTQVERWTEPVLFMMSFDKLITIYEPMVPAEFFQGSESRDYLSFESPPQCKTNIGIPITYSANYNSETGYTTFVYNGESPNCMCESGKKTENECAAHDAEMAAYDATYEKFKDGAKKPEAPKSSNKEMIGDFAVQDIENAFGLESGSLKIPEGGGNGARALKTKKKKAKGAGGKAFEDLFANNFWTDLTGKPTVLNRFLPVTPTERNIFMQGIAALGKPFFQNEADMYHEHVALGCFYRPKNNTLMDEHGLRVCTDIIPTQPGEAGGIAGFSLEWHIAGFIDEYTRLLYVGNDIDSVQFMTEFILVKIVDIDGLLLPEEDFAYQIEGPNHGEYAAYQSPTTIQDQDFYGNVGKVLITQVKIDLDEPCPDQYCGVFLGVDLNTGLPLDPVDVFHNPLASQGPIPWPTKILENKCDWFPCAGLVSCTAPEDGVCGSFEPPEVEPPKATNAPKATKMPKKPKKTETPKPPVPHEMSNCREKFGNINSTTDKINGFNVSEVEAAFELPAGSITTPADAATFDCFIDNYALATHNEIPFALSSLEVKGVTPRSTLTGSLGFLVYLALEIGEDAWSEISAFGCVQTPKPPLYALVLGLTPVATVCEQPVTVRWEFQGFVDDYRFLMRSRIPGVNFPVEYMTDLVLYTISDEITDDSVRVTTQGPNGGAYAGYASIPSNLPYQSPFSLFQSNMGAFSVEFDYLDFSKDCPAEYCENFANFPPDYANGFQGLVLPNPNYPEYPEIFAGDNKCLIWDKAFGCPGYEPRSAKNPKNGKKSAKETKKPKHGAKA